MARYNSAVIAVILVLLAALGFFLFLQRSRAPLDRKEFLSQTGDSAQTQYLAFQIFTGSFSSETMRQCFPPQTKDIATTVRDIIGAIGTVGSQNRFLGFIPGPLSFDNTDGEIRKLMRDSFLIALKENVAVGFHIDDSMFWGRLSHLNSIENIEWLDWDKRPNTGRRLDWSLSPTKIMPQLCFNSPAVRKEVKKRAILIADEVGRGLKALRAVHKEHLFLGIIVGWETQIGRDFDTGKYLGYHALTNKGYSAKNPPLDVDYEREIIVKEFIEFWCKNLSDRGVDKNKIFSHIAFISKKNYDGEKAINPSFVETYLEAANFSPPAVAFGKYHNPGFSTYPQANIFPEIYAELDRNNNPPWASSEGANIALPVARVIICMIILPVFAVLMPNSKVFNPKLSAVLWKTLA